MICDLLGGVSGRRFRLSRFVIATFFFTLTTLFTQAQTELPTTWRDDYFPQFRITINPEDLTAVLAAGSTAKVPIKFDYQGNTYEGTIRQRLGNTSLCGDKRQFRLDFPKKLTFPDGYNADRFETDRGNCYTLHEWVAWKIMDQAAARHPELKVLRKKYNAVAIYFNGELYHVQTLLEDVNKDLLEPQLGTRNITVYENGCYGRTDVTELSGFCTIFSPTEMQQYLQIPSFLYSAAAVQMLGGGDNYPSYPFNYNFVQETATNRIWFMPDDLDDTISSAFVTSNPFEAIYTEGDSQRHFTELMKDSVYREEYRAYLKELLVLLKPEALQPLVAAKYAQVRETLLASPDLPLGQDWYDYVYLHELPAWVEARYAFLTTLLEQGDGDSNRAPTAVIASLPATVEASDVEGVVIQLDGSASSDPDGDNLAFSWKVDGQEVALNVSASVKLAVGEHEIMLTTNDGHGGTGTATARIRILSSNRVPTAVITPLPETIEGRDSDGVLVQLDGSASSDPDGDNLAFSWKVDGQEVAQGVSASVKLAVGEHEIMLTTNDGHGGTGMTTARIRILSPPPPPPPPPIIVETVSPSNLFRGSYETLVITGSGFSSQTTVSFSDYRITPNYYISINERTIILNIYVNDYADSGYCSVTVTNPDGRSVTVHGALTIN